MITEFPFFSLLYADLHAHVIALPFTLLAVGIVVALVGRGTGDLAGGWRGLLATARDFAPSLALLALTLGAVACTNSWDVPTYLLVTGAGLFHALGRRGEATNLLSIARRLALAACGTLATGAAAILLSTLLQQLQGAGRRDRADAHPDAADPLFRPLRALPGDHRAGDRRRVTGADRAATGRSWLAGAVLLAIVAAALGGRATQFTALIADRTTFFANRVQREPDPSFGQTSALLAVLLVMLLALWFFAWGKTRVQLPLTLLIAGVGVTLGPEVIFVADDLMGDDFERMNTVFKFYMQGWTLFAIGGVGALAWVWQTAPRWSLAPFGRVRDREYRRGNAAGLRVFLAIVPLILFLASFAYPVVATGPRINEQFKRPEGLGPTLNGYRWMEYGTVPTEKCQEISFADDYKAIKWMNETIVGTPVIAEAAIGPYRGNGSRFSIATGLPAVLGWDRHEYQQRPAEGIRRRG